MEALGQDREVVSFAPDSDQDIDLIVEPFEDTQNEDTLIDGKIYRMTSRTGHFYIGSTQRTLGLRLTHHKYNSSFRSSSKVYSHFLEVGWGDVTMELIKEVRVTRRQLFLLEEEEVRKYIGQPLCLNTNHVKLTYEEVLERNKEWIRKNPERRRQQMKLYQETHREELREKKSQRYLENRDEIIAKQKIYYDTHREEINRKGRIYTAKNLERIKEYHRTPIHCPKCRTLSTKGYLSVHMKTYLCKRETVLRRIFDELERSTHEQCIN